MGNTYNGISVVMVLMVRHVIDTVDVVPFSLRKVTATAVKTNNVIVDFLMRMHKITIPCNYQLLN